MSAHTYTPNMTGGEESGLIQQILSGRRDLFGDLIGPHLTPLSRILRPLIGGYCDVEDIVQQTALKALLHLEQFRFQASFRTWLIRIGLNEARAWHRKAGSSRMRALDLHAVTQFLTVDESRSPLFEYQQTEITVRLHSAVNRLPEKYRAIVLMRDFEDLNVSEVARRLGLTEPAVKTRHLRARQKLARSLDPLRSRAR